MKSRKKIILFSLLVLTGLLLSACTGVATPSWPGVTVSGDTVYLANNQNVYALTLETGALNWVFPIEPIKGETFFAPPAVSADGNVVAGSYNKNVYALQGAGQQDWIFAEATNSYMGGALINGDLIYAPNADGHLYTLNSIGGKEWVFESEFGFWASPLLDGDRLYLAGMDHFLYCLDSTSGRVIWKTEDLGGAMVSTPVLGADGVLYIGTLGSEMLAIDAQSGEVLDRFSTAGGWVWASPLLYEGNLYFGDLKGNFYGLNAATLETLPGWNYQPEAAQKRQITGAAIAADGNLYVTSETGTLQILDPQNGSRIKSIPIGEIDDKGNIKPGKLYAGPVAAGDLILVAPYGINLYLVALDPQGNIVWSFTPGK
jgi:outer membrane protein assembly factor BamB